MSEIIQNFVSALNEELLSQRKRSTEESYNLQDGERTTSTSDKTIYTFFKENFVNTDVVKRYIKITNSYFIIFVNNYIGYCRIT